VQCLERGYGRGFGILLVSVSNAPDVSKPESACSREQTSVEPPFAPRAPAKFAFQVQALHPGHG
jgi:hypothetical protein